MIFQKFQILFEQNIASNVTKNQESKHITNIITHTKLLETVLNHVVVIPWILVYAVFVAIQKPCKLKSMSYKYRQKNCKKYYYNEILYYKTVLCKFYWTRSKDQVIENWVHSNGKPGMENPIE